ncbi:zinc-binding dehydrogenase [Alteribacillus sp. YIM 98480]|uniref:zinc-dependent alcohol dehydrogenase n=1 Tax=Alteribacillus sp. YIM 98480 TaxID=2606599 RepID=UPI00131D4603|nr:alcohol dehydrogenase catalytic domain-containing protein [Alteribacillus sp. YIM 98480]
MDVVFMEDKEKISIKDYQLPSLNKNEVLIKVKMAGICGSDINTYRGLHPFRKPPVIMGHEVSGEVADIGTEVKSFQNGDKVTVEPQQGCTQCEYCLSGNENLCTLRRAPGVGNWSGTMAEYFIAPSSTVIKLPPETSFETGALIEPLAVGFHAINKANVQPGEKVAILGAGPIGLLTQAAALHKGSDFVMVTDIIDYPLDISQQLGAHTTINVASYTDWVKAAIDNVGDKFDKVIIATDAKEIVNQALQLTKRGGKIVTVAMFHKKHLIDVNNIQSLEKEIIGCMTYNRDDFLQAIELIKFGNIPIEQVISHILPYYEASQGFRLVHQKQDRSLKVLLRF